MNEIDPKNFRDALGRYPTGVTIVTTRGTSGEPVGLTVNSFTSVSLDPPLVLWSIDRSSDWFDDFRRTDHYAVHVLHRDQQEIASLFATEGSDRFASIEYESGIAALPLLADYCAWFHCAVESRIDGGDHLILLGRVLETNQRPGEPLVFHAGQYRQLK